MIMHSQLTSSIFGNILYDRLHSTDKCWQYPILAIRSLSNFLAHFAVIGSGLSLQYKTLAAYYVVYSGSLDIKVTKGYIRKKVSFC